METEFQLIRERGWHQIEHQQGPWRSIVAVPLLDHGHVFAALATHLEANDSRGENPKDLQRWQSSNIQRLQETVDRIAMRWQVGKKE